MHHKHHFQHRQPAPRRALPLRAQERQDHLHLRVQASLFPLHLQNGRGSPTPSQKRPRQQIPHLHRLLTPQEIRAQHLPEPVQRLRPPTPPPILQDLLSNAQALHFNAQRPEPGQHKSQVRGTSKNCLA